MAMSKFGFILLNICTILIVTCGLGRTHTAIVAASATASVYAGRSTSNVEVDQPQCDDPSSELCNASPKTIDADKTTGKLKDQSTCGGNSASGECLSPQSLASEEKPKFKSGDIIELYNSDSRDIQIVFPSIVKGRDPNSGFYHVTKTTDGKDVPDIPEKFLHMYVPYPKGADVLCNIGDFKPMRPIIVRCTVLGYEPAATRGALVLQGQYTVHIHATKASEEYQTKLPVWKLQRRYLSSGF